MTQAEIDALWVRVERGELTAAAGWRVLLAEIQEPREATPTQIREWLHGGSDGTGDA